MVLLQVVYKVKRFFAVLLIVLSSACINTPLPDYYVLTAVPGDGSLSFRQLPDLAVGLGPITIPETVNRANIVTPKDSNQLEVAEFHRWSEPLRENISRVLFTNLAQRMGVNKLYAYPWLRTQIDNVVRLDILQMTGSLGQSVYLQVRWQVLTGSKPYQLLETRITEYRQPVSGEGYSSLVAAYSKAYASLSDDIAISLAQVGVASRSGAKSLSINTASVGSR